MVRRILVVFILGILSAGCASDGLVGKQKIAEGDKAFQEAKQSNAGLNAPGELKVSEEKLSQAREAMEKKDYTRATRLAEEAVIDADYARAKGSAEKSKQTAEEMRKKNEALRLEVERLSRQ